MTRWASWISELLSRFRQLLSGNSAKRVRAEETAATSPSSERESESELIPEQETKSPYKQKTTSVIKAPAGEIEKTDTEVDELEEETPGEQGEEKEPEERERTPSDDLGDGNEEKRSTPDQISAASEIKQPEIEDEVQEDEDVLDESEKKNDHPVEVVGVHTPDSEVGTKEEPSGAAVLVDVPPGDETHPKPIEDPDETEQTPVLTAEKPESIVPGTKKGFDEGEIGTIGSVEAPDSEGTGDDVPKSETGTRSKNTQSKQRPKRSRRIAPVKRGGRPRVAKKPNVETKPAVTTGSQKTTQSRTPRPELVCWKEGMAWVVGVEVPEELAEGDLQVFQVKGESLEEDHVHEMRWPLDDPLGEAIVRWSDETGTKGEWCFEAVEFRVFKITKSGVNGRAVSRYSRGNYLLIAPRALIRDESTDDTVPVAPENVIPEQAELLAHHWLVGWDEDRLLFNEGLEFRPSTFKAYELQGHRIEDDHDFAGPLFGKEPPWLQVDGIEKPAMVVVGIEGQTQRRSPRRAAESFDAVRGWLDDHQPAWFFARLYDVDDKLLDSLDFRYAKDLDSIEIDGSRPLPGPDGHCRSRVKFTGESDLTLSLVDGQAEVSEEVNTFHLPARPDAGRGTWRLKSKKRGDVEIVVQVPRVWWAFTDEQDQEGPTEWTDRSQLLSTEHFHPTSSTILSLFLPRPGWANEVYVGFRNNISHTVQVLKSQHIVHYPLRNLCDVVPEKDCQDLVLSVRSGNSEHGPVTVGEVQFARDLSDEQRFDFSHLSAPRLMSVITKMVRRRFPQDRQAANRLRNEYYRPTRRGGEIEAKEFYRQGLALGAALIECGAILKVPTRWRRRAESIAGLDPMAVAGWKRFLRQSRKSDGELLTG